MAVKGSKGGGGTPLSYSTRGLKWVNVKANKNIVKALQTNTMTNESWAEIKKVVHRANQRITAMYSLAGPEGELISPALNSVMDPIKGKKPLRFKALRPTKNNNVTLIDSLHAYEKAINFLQKPTSTIQGAREYTKHFKAMLSQYCEDRGISYDPDKFVEYKQLAMSEYDNDLIEATWHYTEQSGTITDFFKRVLDKTLSEHVDSKKRLENELHNTRKLTAKEVEKKLNDFTLEVDY